MGNEMTPAAVKWANGDWSFLERGTLSQMAIVRMAVTTAAFLLMTVFVPR
jgi:hypothetical protein